MKILFITLLDVSNLEDFGIYNDFINELAKRGNDVKVISANSSKELKQNPIISNNVEIYTVDAGKIIKTNFLRKGINTLLLESKFIKTYKKFLRNEIFELVIYTTPPITFNRLIRMIKSRENAKSYLLLKDIFPQNAVDLKILTKYNPITLYFRWKERKLYEISDFIGGMSPGNIKYIQRNNHILSKTHVFRNALYEQNYRVSVKEEIDLKLKLGLDLKKKILLYGGNIGLPQSPDYISKIIDRFEEIQNAQFIIVGSGTHYACLERIVNESDNKNIKILKYLPQAEYKKLISISDIGLIFLDHRFTIPNYPSRLTNLLNAGKPVLVASDKNTDIGKEIEEWGVGFWNQSDNIDAFISNANKLINSENLDIYSQNAYKIFEKEFKIEKNIDELLNLINDNR